MLVSHHSEANKYSFSPENHYITRLGGYKQRICKVLRKTRRKRAGEEWEGVVVGLCLQPPHGRWAGADLQGRGSPGTGRMARRGGEKALEGFSFHLTSNPFELHVIIRERGISAFVQEGYC